MKNIITKLSLSLVLSLSLSAKQTYTIDDLILQAMDNSPDLKISASQYDASKQTLIVADAGYLPVVDLSVSAGQFGQSDIQNNKPDDMVDSTGIVGTVAYSNIPFAVFLGIFLGDKFPNLLVIVGIVLIIISSSYPSSFRLIFLKEK